MCTDLLILAGSFLLCICITKKCNFRVETLAYKKPLEFSYRRVYLVELPVPRVREAPPSGG
ncbi:hypothetical protein JYU34_017849 [Plutella xylostella]|uniref:Uncharacterized protein n=1 Tax=Plutella xylostella TaxID=51655 RepID=A0ABQ7PZZ1_PLUXY|nr:hypothetical protein JYU34_017849 [Plutella xylostella]